MQFVQDSLSEGPDQARKVSHDRHQPAAAALTIETAHEFESSVQEVVGTLSLEAARGTFEHHGFLKIRRTR
jgi:hypothetical protein